MLVEVPLKLLINYRYALKDQNLRDFFDFYHIKYQENAISNSTSKLTRLDALYFLLIISKFDPDGFLHKFVNSMPTTYDTPEYFSQDLIETLPSCFKSEISDRLLKFKSKFNFIHEILGEYLKTVDNAKSAQLLFEKLSYEHFKWAFCSVNSRCFHVEENDVCSEKEIDLGKKYFGPLVTEHEDHSFFLNCESLSDFNRRTELKTETMNNLCCIIPYLDFLNHSFKANATAALEKKSGLYVLKSKSKDEWFGDDEIKLKSNDQLYITYGCHDNLTLLIEYGFILEENLYDRIIFRIEDFSVLIRDHKKAEIVWCKAIRDKISNDLSCNKTEGPSWNLLRLVDLISHVNTSKITSEFDLGFYESYEINNPDQVRALFLDFLKLYEKDFERSLTDLSRIAKTRDEYCYHVDVCLKLTRIYLEMITFNLKFVNNDKQWLSLF